MVDSTAYRYCFDLLRPRRPSSEDTDHVSSWQKENVSAEEQLRVLIVTMIVEHEKGDDDERYAGDADGH